MKWNDLDPLMRECFVSALIAGGSGGVLLSVVVFLFLRHHGLWP